MTKIIPITRNNDALTAGFTRHQLVQAAWNFAYAALWNHKTFTAKDTSLSKQHIERYLTENGHAKKSFLEFCQRIMMARQELPQTGLPAPSTWLNPVYPDGYAATLRAWQQIETLRSYGLHYQNNLVLVARYYLRAVNDYTGNSFRQGRSRLLHTQEHGLLQLYCMAVCYNYFLHDNASSL